MARYKQHLFICTNSGKEVCCSNKNSLELAKSLKTRCRDAFGSDVRINKSGCLGGCKKGVVAVLYPEGKYYENLSLADEDRLFADISTRLEEG